LIDHQYRADGDKKIAVNEKAKDTGDKIL